MLKCDRWFWLVVLYSYSQFDTLPTTIYAPSPRVCIRGSPFRTPQRWCPCKPVDCFQVSTNSNSTWLCNNCQKSRLSRSNIKYYSESNKKFIVWLWCRSVFNCRPDTIFSSKWQTGVPKTPGKMECGIGDSVSPPQKMFAKLNLEWCIFSSLILDIRYQNLSM